MLNSIQFNSIHKVLIQIQFIKILIRKIVIQIQFGKILTRQILIQIQFDQNFNSSNPNSNSIHRIFLIHRINSTILLNSRINSIRELRIAQH